jgi:hypothetical protein
MRYFNTWVNSQDLPWHYGLGWIHVSTPWIYLVFIWIRIVLVIIQLIHHLMKWCRFYESDAQRNHLIFFGLSVVPLAIVIIRHSVIYDS